LVDKHPSFRELRVAAETQSAYRLPICMVVEVVLLAREPKLQRTESLRTAPVIIMTHPGYCWAPLEAPRCLA
jgi:hypothetical protein